MTDTSPIQIAILAPTLAVRVGLRTLLGGNPAFEIVCEVPDAAGLVGWDIDILIVQSQDISDLDGLAGLVDGDSSLGLLWIHDDFQEGQTIRRLPLTAWGMLSSEASTSELIAAVYAIDQGLIVAPPILLRPLLIEAPTPEQDARIEELTPRETEILELLAQGLANKQIALALNISEHTVKFHVSSIYAKLGAANRMEAVRLGLQLGLTTL